MKYCFSRMLGLLVFAVVYLLMNSIIVTKLLKDSNWKCDSIYSSEIKELIEKKHDCLDLGGDWIESDYNFNTLATSISTLFMVQSSEGWIKIMFDSYDSTTTDTV